MSTGAPSYPHLKSHRAKRGPRWPGPGRNPGPRDDSEGRPQPRYRPLAHPPREIRSLPTAGKFPQPTLAEKRTHRDTAHACSTCSAPRSVRLTYRPDPLSLALFVSPSRSFCRSLLSPSLSLSPVRETVLPSPVTFPLSSTHRRALFTRHPAPLCNFADTTAQWRNARGEKRRQCREKAQNSQIRNSARCSRDFRYGSRLSVSQLVLVQAEITVSGAGVRDRSHTSDLMIINAFLVPHSLSSVVP